MKNCRFADRKAQGKYDKNRGGFGFNAESSAVFSYQRIFLINFPILLYGHGGGDVGMINTIIDFYDGKDKMRTTINQSMQSHYIGFSAELSRKNGGNVVEIE